MKGDDVSERLVHRTTCRDCGFDSGLTPFKVVHSCRRQVERVFKETQEALRAKPTEWKRHTFTAKGDTEGEDV